MHVQPLCVVVPHCSDSGAALCAFCMQAVVTPVGLLALAVAGGCGGGRYWKEGSCWEGGGGSW